MQGIGRQHRRHGVEEQQLLAQQPAEVFVDQVLGDEADQRFEIGGADFPSVLLLPAEFITNYTLLGVKQGFTDDEVGLMHYMNRRVKLGTMRRPLAHRTSGS
jgi:hypothetical protein